MIPVTKVTTSLWFDDCAKAAAVGRLVQTIMTMTKREIGPLQLAFLGESPC